MESSFDIANAIAVLLQIAVLLYTAYFAFGIRRTLFVAAYKHQALGVGLVALTFGLVVTNNYIFSYIYNKPTAVIQNNLGPLGLPGLFTGILLAFNWIDASATAGRRADPYFRDSLRWSQARRIIWPLVVLSYVIVVSSFLYLETLSGFSQGGGPPYWIFLPSVVFFLVIPLTGIVLLPVVAWRAKDPGLRRQIGWFALFFTPPLASGFVIGFFGNVQSQLFAYYAVQFMADLFLYFSARSLVPLYSFSKTES